MIYDSLEFYDMYKSRCLDQEKRIFSKHYGSVKKKRFKIKLDQRVIDYFNGFGQQSKMEMENVLLQYIATR